MKIYKHWYADSPSIKIDGESVTIKLLMGSDVSKEDARRVLLERAAQIESRIQRKAGVDEYEADIKEAIAHEIDANNVITVCRYGALILNTTQYSIYDLDGYHKSMFDFFGPMRQMSLKQRIVHKFKITAAKIPELGRSFRIYETSKGIRVIGKQYLDPGHKRFLKIMLALCADYTYSILCIKQRCFRARLTPKPYRMKIDTFKVLSPLECETAQYQSWAAMYASEAQAFSVVKLIEAVGDDFANEPVIAEHDRRCNMSAELKLA